MELRLGTKTLIALLFIFSGATSLVYQTLWIRILSLGVGSTSASISMVLSIFFFGLSVGSYLSGKYTHKIKNHLRAYGVIEGVIGLYSLGLVYTLLNFHHLLSVFPLSGSFSWIGIFFKFFLVFLLLIVPTVGMGATLPILIKLFVKKDDQSGRFISFLYGVNTLGAVLGAFISSFALIPNLGVVASNHLAAAVNGVILVVAWVMANKGIGENEQAVPAQAVQAEQAASIRIRDLSGKQLAVFVACGVAGFAAISSEVVWNKYLGIFFGTNIYGLGVLLGLYLLGIALGSFLLSIFIPKVKNKMALFTGLFIAAMATTLMASYAFNWAPVIANIASYYLGESVNLLLIKAILTAVILFVPTSISGALLPLGINIISESASKAPAVTGVTYAINTLGSILGSYCAGIIIIPWLGSSNMIRLSVLALGISCLWLIFRSSDHEDTWTRTQNKLGRFVSGGVAVALILLALFTQNLDFKNIIKSAYHQSAQPDMSFSDAMQYFSRDYEDFRLIVEGKTAIISMSHDRQDGDDYKSLLRLKTNGLNESIYNMNNLNELPKYEALLGLLPYVFVPDPNSAFIVGYGGGYTVNLLSSTSLKDVNVVELEQGILEAADLVYKNNNPILKRKNLDLQIEDARYVLANKLGGPYDIVVSQPSHSWLSGVANLFTQEFFEIVKSNLTEQGIFSQWLNLYNMDTKVLKSILKTFYTVFPHGAVFTDLEDDELIMLGSTRPLQLDQRRLQQVVDNPRINELLGMVPIIEPFDLLATFNFGRSKVLEFAADAQINTDRNAYAEVNQSQLFYKGDSEDESSPQEFLSAQYDGNFDDILAPDVKEMNDFYYRLLLSLKTNYKYEKFYQVMRKYEQNVESQLARVGSQADLLPAQDQLNLGYLSLQYQRYDSARDFLQKAIDLNPSTDAFNLYLSALVELGDFQLVMTEWKKSKIKSDPITHCHVLHAALEVKDSNPGLGKRYESDIASLSKKLIADQERYVQSCGTYYYKVLGYYYFDKKDYAKAVRQFEEYYAEYSADVEVLEKMIVSYFQVDDRANGRAFSGYIQTAVDDEVGRLRDLAQFYSDRGLIRDSQVLEARAEKIVQDSSVN